MEQPAAHDRLIGAPVGNYVVREKLGEGGMGSVYLAEHPRIGKKVALKVLHAEFSANEEVVARFFNEARAVNDIQHPNIVDIIDYGELPGAAGEANMVYFIMEFLAGDPLNKLLSQEGPLPVPRALHIAVQIADALAASHQNHIVHRDLKPDNVILLQRQREPDFVKVLDFGIAKLTGDQKISHRTRTGMVMGTPAYMSPEQCEGKGMIDHRTDCYALGILLYEMITGRVPFEGEGYGEVLVQHLTQPPQRLSLLVPAVDPHVEAVCMKALAKRPDDRFATMDEFVRALQDPAGYIGSLGGLAALAEPWAGAAAPMDPTHRIDPVDSQPYAATPPAVAAPHPGNGAPGHVTPPPGQAPPVTPYPAHAGPTPAPGAGPARGGIGRPVVIALAALVVLGGVGGGWILFAGGSSPVAAAPDAAAPDAGPPDAAVALDEADAAPPPPDAAREPAEPEMVVIDINSTPGGAAIFLDGERIGRTPHRLEVEKGDEEMSFTLRRRGHRPRTQPFVPDMARAFNIHLPQVHTQRDDDDDDNGNDDCPPWEPDC